MEHFIPERIATYLHDRGLTDAVLSLHKITWDGERIVIPVFDKDGVWLFNKYRRDPAISTGPKYTYDTGATSALYGAEKIASASQVIICEGEFDSLILEVHGFVGVSSTGGSGTFKEEWLADMAGKEVFICFDNDEAGMKGIERVTRMMPSIKNIPLPPEVGQHGDITDFFVKLKKTRKDFERFMKFAAPIKLEEEPKPSPRKRSKTDDRLKAAKEVPLTLLLKFNRAGFAKCPFHKDKTPSFHWMKQANRYHCFGCGEDGDVIDFVMKMQGMPISDAIDYLLKL